MYIFICVRMFMCISIYIQYIYIYIPLSLYLIMCLLISSYFYNFLYSIASIVSFTHLEKLKSWMILVLLQASAACLQHGTALLRAVRLLQAPQLEATQLEQLGLQRQAPGRPSRWEIHGKSIRIWRIYDEYDDKWNFSMEIRWHPMKKKYNIIL